MVVADNMEKSNGQMTIATSFDGYPKFGATYRFLPLTIVPSFNGYPKFRPTYKLLPLTYSAGQE